MTSILEKTRFLITHKPKKPGFWQFYEVWRSILEKTRFLIAREKQRNRVFRSFYEVWRSILEKTRFLTARKSKKPGFWQFLGGVAKYSGKNPVSRHPSTIH